MAGAFDHYLYVVFPGDLGEFTQGLQLTELRGIIGIGQTTRTQAIAQREAFMISQISSKCV